MQVNKYINDDDFYFYFVLFNLFSLAIMQTEDWLIPILLATSR